MKNMLYEVIENEELRATVDKERPARNQGIYRSKNVTSILHPRKQSGISLPALGCRDTV